MEVLFNFEFALPKNNDNEEGNFYINIYHNTCMRTFILFDVF